MPLPSLISRPGRRLAVTIAAAAAGLALAGPARGQASAAVDPVTRCPEGRLAAGQAADLWCLDLLPTGRARGARGAAMLSFAPSPFVVAVTPEGTHALRLALAVDGLPDPATLGPWRRYVVWAAGPTLSPVRRLGVLAEGRVLSASVALDKFLVLVTAEADTAGETWEGPVVLRGTSPTMALQPHESAAILAAAVGETGHRHDPGGSDVGWIVPPMHPAVPMIAGVHHLRPDARPWLPPDDPEAPPVQPTRIVPLADGDTLDLVAAKVRRVVGGRSITMYAFNGMIPGPLIRVARGSEIVVRFENRIDLPTAVHWHGIRLENRFDGVPGVTQEAVPPGGTFVYRVRFPDGGIYWYHPHHREDVQQDLGLYGNLLVDVPGAYGPANREVALVLDDLLVAPEGLVPFGAETATHALMGRFGTVPLVSGEPRWEAEVARGEVVRLYLTNAANARTWNVSFENARMKVVATDLGRFEREAWVESVPLAPAERYVVDVRFDRPGTALLLHRARAIDMVYGNFVAETDTLGIVRVGEAPAAPDHGAAFSRLAEPPDVALEIERYRNRLADPPDLTLELSVAVDSLPFPLRPLLAQERVYAHPLEWAGTMPVMNWATTGRSVRWILRDLASGAENRAIEWRFRVGDLVRIRIVNDREAFHVMHHPIHVHGQRFLIAAVNGVPASDRAWKDTVVVPAGGSVDLLLELSNPGDWMLHCHIAEHLEAGMKTVFTVTESEEETP